MSHGTPISVSACAARVRARSHPGTTPGFSMSHLCSGQVTFPETVDPVKWGTGPNTLERPTGSTALDGFGYFYPFILCVASGAAPGPPSPLARGACGHPKCPSKTAVLKVTIQVARALAVAPSAALGPSHIRSPRQALCGLLG